MENNAFIIEKIAKRDLAKCYITPYTTFRRRMRALYKDETCLLQAHKNHSFTTKEVRLIVEELGMPKYSLEQVREIEKIS